MNSTFLIFFTAANASNLITVTRPYLDFSFLKVHNSFVLNTNNASDAIYYSYDSPFSSVLRFGYFDDLLNA